MTGDLTARCAAYLAAVLDTLARKAGPEDTRTTAQRRHDALEEACRRLLASGCLPDRAGQPVHLNLQLTLDQLLNGLDPHPGENSPAGTHPANCGTHPGGSGPGGRGPGGSGPGSGPGWTGPGGAGPGTTGADGPDRPEPGWPAAAAAGPGDDCDAALVPMVTGRVDHDLLDTLAARLVPGTPLWAAFHPARPAPCEHCGHTPPRSDHHPGTGHPGHHGDGPDLGRAAARRLLLETAVAPAVRPGRPGVAAAHRHPPPARRLGQPAPGRGAGDRAGAAAPAPRDHRPR